MEYIKKSDINYLVFEGGGGAGNAFPGALQALVDEKILEHKNNLVSGQIKGFGGASAGAINALFLSLGYTPEEMVKLLNLPENDFENFFDTPDIKYRPYINRRTKSTKYNDDIAALGQYLAKTKIFGFMESIFTSYFSFFLSASNAALVAKATTSIGAKLTAAKVTQLYVFMFGCFLTVVSFVMFGKMPAKMAKQITNNVSNKQVQKNLLSHYGIFPGFTFRDFLAKYITTAVRRVKQTNTDTITVRGTTKKMSEITFADHKEIFKVDLIVTGTNLETLKSFNFSASTSPDFPIADAVRISMSIPFAFQPLILRNESDLKKVASNAAQRAQLKGVWVDGGLLNNTPVAAFDQIAGSHKHTLALRLRKDARTEVSSIFSFLKVYPLSLGILGTGEAYVDNGGNFTRTVIIPVSEDDLGLFTFKPDKKTFEKVNDESSKVVKKFFEDIANIERLRNQIDTGSKNRPVAIP
jgi:NTE family protein